MNQKSVKLDNAAYQEYLTGKEVLCPAGQMTTKNLQEGDHVLVYKDTVTANSDVTPPKREMQSEYIGVEGIVTGVRTKHGTYEGVVIRKI